jgi:hypothetical protein
MAQALLTAELLTHHVLRGLGTGDAWLWRYERERGALLRDYRILTGVVLMLAQHPWLARSTLTFLRAHPSVFSHLVGVAAGLRRFSGAVPSPGISG